MIFGSEFPKFETFGRAEEGLHRDPGHPLLVYGCHGGRDLVEVKVRYVVEVGMETGGTAETLFG